MVGTGLVGEDAKTEEVKGKSVFRGMGWKVDANRALGLVFEVGQSSKFQT